MAKQMFYDSWTNQHFIVDSEEIEKITKAIDNIIKEDSLITASNREIFLWSKLDTIKLCKDRYIEACEKAKALHEQGADSKTCWEAHLYKAKCLQCLLEKIDRIFYEV